MVRDYCLQDNDYWQDLSGAGLEALSGLASTLPGLGTAVSVGLDATLAAKYAFIGGDGATWC